MFRSLKHIYEKLFEVLDDEFGPEAETSLLKTFQRGFFFQKSPRPAEYPLGFMEWGRVSKVEVYQAPEEYQYVVAYRLFYFMQTGGNPTQLEGQVFRPDEDTDKQLGIGDFAERVCNFFWTTHHTSRFSVAWDRPDNTDPDVEWSILELTMDASIITFTTVTDVTLLSIRQFLEDNPDFRGIQINFSFRVREREVF